MSQMSAEVIRRAESSAEREVGRGHWIALIAIILFGAILRFICLDRPTLWGDETAVWARTVGPFRDLLETNRVDGFMPLHYEFYWWLTHTWQPTPWLMRLPCAIAGTLMIPAMYFLARQLAKPRVALLVAFLAATSSYLLSYSRDAKMYTQTWLLVTLHAGCIFWWLRRGGGVAWWSWVASGVAMVGVHAPAWLVLAVDIPAVLMCCWSSGRGWAKGLLYLILFLVGLGIMGIGPAIYKTYYNTWAERSGGLAPGATAQTAEGEWHNSGLDWIKHHVDDKTGLEQVRDSASSYLINYARAEEMVIDGRVPIPQWVLDTAWGTLTGIILVLLVAAIPWSSRSAPCRLTLEHWGRWKVSFWLAAWLILPTYGFFYCRSVRDADSPVIWLQNATAYIGFHIFWALPAVVLLTWIATRSRPFRVVLAWLAMLSVLALVVCSTIIAHAQWYLWLLDLPSQPVLTFGLLVTGIALACSCPGLTTRERLRSILSFLFLAAVILILCEAAWLGWAHARKLAADAVQSGAWQSMWMPRYLGIACPAVLLVMGIAILRLPGRLLRVAVVICFVGVNLISYAARVFPGNEPRVDLVARDIAQGYKDASVRVYVRDHTFFPSPANSTILDWTGKYYLAQYAQGTYVAQQARWGPSQEILPFNSYYSSRAVVNDMRRRPIVDRLIVWDRQSVSQGDVQTLGSQLGSRWRLTHKDEYVVRRHFNWQDMDNYYRLEFVRIEPEPIPLSATRPAPAATSKSTPRPAASTAPASPW